MQGQIWTSWRAASVFLFVSFACSYALADPSATVSRGSDGNQHFKMDVIDIEGRIPKEPPRVTCGDCRDGVYDPIQNTTLLPNPNAPVVKTKQQLEQEAKQAHEDAQVLYVRKIRKEQEPLENESMVIKWLTDRAKNKLLPIGPWSWVLDSLEPTAGGISEFDQARTKDEVKTLRIELDAEERELRRQREQNAELYEQNMRHLEPTIYSDEISRGLAALPELNKMQETLVARANLRSEDYGFVVQQLLSRTRFDADIRMPEETVKRVSRVIWRATPSNVCVAHTSPPVTCALDGFRKGHPCFCPNPNGAHYAPVKGKASRNPVGSICRYEDVAVDLRRLYPTRTQCGIPVNVSWNRDVPIWEYLTGEITER